MILISVRIFSSKYYVNCYSGNVVKFPFVQYKDKKKNTKEYLSREIFLEDVHILSKN